MRPDFKLAELTRYAGVGKSSYYYHRRGLTATDKYAELRSEIREIFEENEGRYGYRRIAGELDRRGIHINHKTVYRLMREMSLKAIRSRRRYKSYKGDFGKHAPNLLSRDFHAQRPNEKWATDVSEFRIKDKRIYLSPIIDLYNAEIIAYEISASPNMVMIQKMLKTACMRLDGEESPILHSDQGFQYQHHLYHRILKENGIVASMSRKGNCLDNGAVEGFFGQLKSELFYVRKYNDVDTFVTDLKDYIDYYNNKRIRQSLGYLSPVEFREAGCTI